MTVKERDRIFEENYGLIHKVLNDNSGFFAHPGILTRDDLSQIGAIGLLNAIETYSPEKKCRFSTYAYVLIRNAIINELTKETRHHGKDDYDDDYLLSLYQYENAPQAPGTYNDLLQLIEEAKENAADGVRLGIDAIVYMTQGYSGNEIAEMLGTTPGNVRVCVSRARKYLLNDPVITDYFR